ncbi:hypothetical protein [Corallococcus sp. 4LFB]|uniref:hypothetical protein n=1 Tax=Corallococcus sp. 4LFB TaxID=3383249 RepID=UPI00397693CD
MAHSVPSEAVEMLLTVPPIRCQPEPVHFQLKPALSSPQLARKHSTVPSPQGPAASSRSIRGTRSPGPCERMTSGGLGSRPRAEL